MTRLRKQFVAAYKGKKYHKWVLNLPPEHVEALGWGHGTELEVKLRKDGVFVREAAETEGDA